MHRSRRWRLPLLVALVLAVALVTATASHGAGTAVEQVVLAPAEGEASELFGEDVSISGDTALVGAPHDPFVSTTSPGAAYVYVRTGGTWTEQQKLVPPDGDAEDYFGYSVSLDGDTALVGSPDHATDNGKTGAAYVFVRCDGVWSLQQMITPADAADGDALGQAVSLSGESALIGAPGRVEGGLEAGAAYVYVRSGSNWTEQQKLLEESPAEGDMVGSHVAIHGDTAIVSAPTRAKGALTWAGVAYVFTRDGATWTLQQALQPADVAKMDTFGEGVAICGDTALIGAPSPSGTNPGAAYVFVRSGGTWSQESKLTASDGMNGDRFGHSVGLVDGVALVGAPMHTTTAATKAGAAYLFTSSAGTWTQSQRLTASDGAQDDRFGAAVDMSGDTLLVGAYGRDTATAEDVGAAYVFGPMQWQVTLSLDPTAVLPTPTATVTASGTVTTTEDVTLPEEAAVTIEKRRQGSEEWSNCGTATLDAEGRYSTSIVLEDPTPATVWEFRAKMPADPELAVAEGYSEVATLTVLPMRQWQVTLSLVPTGEVRPGTPVTFGGTAKLADGTPARGTVTIEKRRQGSEEWLAWRTATLAADGSYAVTVEMTTANRVWQFRTRVAGDAALAIEESYSPVAELTVLSSVTKPKWQVSLVLSAHKVKPGATVTYRGTVKTAEGKAGKGTVIIQKRRQGTSQWQTWRKPVLKSGGRYVVSVKMTTANRVWQFRAKMPANAANATAYSATKVLTVTRR